MKVVLFCLALLAGSVVQAQEYGIVAGLNSSKFKSDAYSWKREMGFTVGAQMLYPFSELVVLRTGASFIQKGSSSDRSGITLDLTFTYLEIPLTVLFNVSDVVGLIAGFNLDFKLSESCETSNNFLTCKPLEPKSITYTAVIGGRFNVAEPHFVEVLYEMGLADLYKETKLDNSFLVQYAYMF